jgi:hypothetical protein
MDMQTALKIAKAPGSNVDAYREAIEFLIDNRDQLKHRIYVNLPGGFIPNKDTFWAKIKANTDERCNCGNERILVPTNVRTDFIAGTAITIKPGEKVYLRPVGGDRESAYVRFENDVELKALTYILDPFGPIMLSPDLFSTKGFELAQLAPQCGPDAVLSFGQKDVKTPIGRFDAVDVQAGTVTITLDQDVETFDGDAEKPRHE